MTALVGGRATTRPLVLGFAAVFLLGAAARLWVLFSSGNPLDAPSYDQSVYYAAAAALVHGHVLYHGDVVLVHPPVIALVGTPFAALARLTDDATGFVAENAALALIGAVNAVLVVVVARTWDLRRGALAAGVVYALWAVGVAAESTARLEPVGNLFLLLSLWAFGRGRTGSTWPLVRAGVFLAVLVNVKLWWAAPVLAVVVLTAVLTRRLRVVTVPVAAAVVTAVLLDVPFLLLAGPRMFRSIVLAQLDRPGSQWSPGGQYVRLSIGQRLEQLTGADRLVAAVHGGVTAGDTLVAVVAAVIALAFVAAVVLAYGSPVGRVFLGVLVVQLLVLMSAPVYYPYYGDYVAATGALVIAAAVTGRRVRGTAAVPWGWALATAIAGVVWISALGPSASPTDWQALRRQTAHVPCVVADSPYVLIRLHALDRSFGPGCRNVVDFQGLSYGAGPEPAARGTLRSATPQYQQFATRYLTSGDAVVVSLYYNRLRLGPANRRLINQLPVLARSGNLVVRCTPRWVVGDVCRRG